MKLTSAEVLKTVENEIEYSKEYDCKVSEPPDRIAHADKPLELWLLWMEQYLADARKQVTSGYNKPQALHHLRVVLSLGFQAAMHHGLPGRVKPPHVSGPGGPGPVA